MTNGSPPTAPPVTPKRVPLAQRIVLQNQETERLTYLMLGNREPELATALTPAEARKLAEALIAHADHLERAVPRIILPGGLTL